jgi:hypothetical protein
MRKSTTTKLERESVWYNPTTGMIETWDGMCARKEIRFNGRVTDMWYIRMDGPTNPEDCGYVFVGYV